MDLRIKWNITIKYYFLLLCFIVCIMFTGCKKEKYQFMEDLSQISNIEIVELLGFETIENEGLKPILKTICIIKDKQAFLDDFTQLSCSYRWNDPTGIDMEYIGRTILKIEYVDGKYELISNRAQAEYGQILMGGEKYKMYDGRYNFNEEEFNNLIEKYIQ